MDKSQNRIKVSAVFPWFVILMLILSLIFVMVKRRGEEKGRLQISYSGE